jgi:hypothetical protein
MSERVRTEVSPGSWVGAPSLEDARRQLEGRVEMVEASRERYAALEALLSGRGWKRRLRGRPEALQSVLRHEPAFHEALDRIQRRAQADHWPEHSRVLVTLRDVGGLRGRLEALVRKRLGELAGVSGPPSLVEDLTRLERLVFQSIPLELSPGEVRLMEGDSADLWFVLQTYASIILGLIASRFWGDPGAFVLLVLLVANIVHGVLRSGKYWLTNERLMWKPHTGEPVQIPLRSIPEDGIRTTPFGVRVVGDRKLYLQDVSQGRLLAVLMELRRQAPLRDAACAERLADVVCYEATLRNGFSWSGYVVLRPGYAAFLPKNQGREILRAITGVRPSWKVRAGDIPHVIEQLRYLPSEAAFDACVERAVAAAGGVRWSAWESRYDASEPVWREIRISAPGERGGSLRGKVGWSQQAEAMRLLLDWPKR